MKYNYLESIKEDVKMYIEENKENESYNIEDLEELQNILYDDLFIEDSVTGNASGSYYCNAWKAREAVAGNEDILSDALEEFGGDAESYKKALIDPEYADVTIRCYLLGQAISEVIEEMKNKNNVIITIIKNMSYIDENKNTITKQLYKKTTRDLTEAKKILNDEILKNYNSKFLQVTETIEASYKEENNYKKIYKTISSDGEIKKNY